MCPKGGIDKTLFHLFLDHVFLPCYLHVQNSWKGLKIEGPLFIRANTGLDQGGYPRIKCTKALHKFWWRREFILILVSQMEQRAHRRWTRDLWNTNLWLMRVIFLSLPKNECSCCCSQKRWERGRPKRMDILPEGSLWSLEAKFGFCYTGNNSYVRKLQLI